MPEAAEIRTAIQTLMQGVADMGVVHDYERYTKHPAEFRALYLEQDPDTGKDRIRGWYVRRLARREASDYNGRTRVTMTWRIQGYVSLDDETATEKVFDALLDALVAAFRADETLGSVVDSTIVGQDAGLQIEDTGPVYFGGVLCHSARGRLMTQHFI